MKFLIRLILSLLIGTTVGFVISIINDSAAIFITAAATAFLVALILGGSFGKTRLRLLIVAIGAIIAFFACFFLLCYLNEKVNSFSETMIIYCVPYVLIVFVVLCSMGADS